MTDTMVPLPVSRWACPFCRVKAYMSKASAARHMKSCAKNPVVRSCSSCFHFTRRPCCDSPSDDCGCGGLNECAVNAFESWRYNDHKTLDVVADGWWTHVVDWRRDCPSHQT